jgi:hypothetical protein
VRIAQADNFIELFVPEQFADQLAFATAQVENSLGSACSQGRHDGSEALLVEADGLLQHLLSLLLGLIAFIGFGRLLLLNKAGQRQPEKAWLVFQVTSGDLFFLRVAGQPALTLCE